MENANWYKWNSLTAMPPYLQLIRCFMLMLEIIKNGITQVL